MEERILDMLEAVNGVFSISCKFMCKQNNSSWVFTGVYDITLHSEKESFWSELEDKRGLWGDPWCGCGDFNVVRYPLEKSMKERINFVMRRFSEVIDYLELCDIPLQGGRFTWRGGRNIEVASRLDRFLFYNAWTEIGGNVA